MKKSLSALIIASCCLLVWFQQPVHADLQENTKNCFMRSILHADGSFSEKEKQILENSLRISSTDLQTMKQDCMTSPKQLLKDLQTESENYDAVMVLVISAYIAKADGEVQPTESKLIEDFLETFNKKREIQPLLDICEGELSDEIVNKVISVYSFSESLTYKAKRAEVPMNLKAIKTAQISYMQDYDVYVRCAAYPSVPSKEPQKWDVSASGGFKTIDFQPSENVRGSYMVATTPTNFTAIGIIDVDGDGVYATYIATKSENPNAPITAPDVY